MAPEQTRTSRHYREVIYSKVLRKMMKELVMFSLVTSATDVGAGAYGAPPNYRDLDFR